MALLKKLSDRWNRKHFEKLQDGDMDVINAQKLEQLGCVRKANRRYEDAILNFEKAKFFATLLGNKDYKAKAESRIGQAEQNIEDLKEILGY